jgi:hypothetical protein
MQSSSVLGSSGLLRVNGRSVDLDVLRSNHFSDLIIS